ncbi:MAG: aspartate/glutamate racemase family protein, partial [Candidatus Omnitrophota bacterium]
IIGVIEPGAKEAVELTENLNIGVIGTSATIQSAVYDKEIKRFLPKANVYSKSCPLFVPLVEEGWLDNDITLEIIKHYLAPVKESGIDTIILGCTHYPLLKSSIIKVLGKEIKVVDSACSVAKAASELLSNCNLKADDSDGGLKFFVSDEPDKFAKVGKRFLNQNLSCVRKVE